MLFPVNPRYSAAFEIIVNPSKICRSRFLTVEPSMQIIGETYRVRTDAEFSDCRKSIAVIPPAERHQLLDILTSECAADPTPVSRTGVDGHLKQG